MTLRPLAAADAESVAPWMAETVAAVDGARPDAETAATLDGFCAWATRRWRDARLDAISLRSGPIGFMIWRPCALAGADDLQIDALAVRRDMRNLGHGVEAVAQLEMGHPGATVYAPIPRANGLALYFWLRAGYRPVRLDELQEIATDAERLWMVRRPSAGRSGGRASRPGC